MATRPNFIDLRSHSHGPFGSALPSPSIRGLPSPRLHVAGDVPPELSPLDAFAAQSRLLAKQLDETTSGGRRVSRLPPLAIANTLGQNKPGIFRSISAEGVDVDSASPQTPGSGLKSEVETPGFRPVSMYPQLGGGPPAIPQAPSARLDVLDEEEFRGRRPRGPANEPPFFGARREQSPAAVEKDKRSSRNGNSASSVPPRPNIEAMRLRGLGPRRDEGAFSRGRYDSRALAPPPSPYAQRTPSPRSMSDASDDGFANGFPSPHRKLSTGSGMSTSPRSPSVLSMPRSPSICSEISVGGTMLPRPSFNFSRPLSRASATGVPVEIPSRQASSDSQPSFVLADDTANTPVSMHSEGFPDHENENGGAPSYVYSRFNLPRGKMLQRNSLIFQGEMPQGEHPAPTSNGGAPPSPPTRPSTSSVSRPELSRPSMDTRPSLDPGRPSFDPGRPSLDPGRPSYDRARPSTDHGRVSRFSESIDRPDSPSAASSSTIKARSQHSLAPSAEWSAEEHVTKAIEYHEAGALTKSTYHLRLAARQNHPTGMLLYALACRHGWGMRPNQKDGVAWLRKAAESAQLEVADDEELEHDGKAVDLLKKKARKAQFALSIYELGVSHMNGWGIGQDKALALRCFEIAGSWGDVDALAEAGYCYAQGIGCKKDLKKSAKLYRQAEAKGISMVGNSWIYKSKYAEDGASKKSGEVQISPKKEKKPRDKSRTRTLFHRSKTTV